MGRTPPILQTGNPGEQIGKSIIYLIQIEWQN